MADDSQLAELYVSFVAKGLDEVSAVTEEYRRRLNETNSAADLLAKTLGSGAYEDVARRTHAAAVQMKELTDQAQRIDYAVRGGLQTEAFDKFDAKLKATRHEAALLERALSSGLFASFASQMAEETARLDTLKRKALDVQNLANGYRPAARLAPATPIVPQAARLAPVMAIAQRAPTQEMRWADEYRQKVTDANRAAEKSAFMTRLQYGELGASFISAGDKAQAFGQRLNLLGSIGSRTWAVLAGGGTLAIAGLAQQGLSGTVELHQFLFAIQLIAREVAGLFVPAIRTATQWLQRVSAYLRTLDGDQQEHARKWLLMAAGAALFAATLPRVIGMGGSLLTTLGRLGPVLGVSAAAAGPWGLAIAAGLAVAAAGFAVAYARSAEFRAEVAKLVQAGNDLYKSLKPVIDFALDQQIALWTTQLKAFTAQLRIVADLLDRMNRNGMGPAIGLATGGVPGFVDALKREREAKAGGGAGGQAGKGRDEVTLMQTGFESLQATFDRMQEAVLRAETGAGDPAKDTAKATKDTADNTKKIADFLDSVNPFNLLGNLGPDLFGRKGGK